MRKLTHIPLWHHPRFWDALIAVLIAGDTLAIAGSVWLIMQDSATAAAGWVFLSVCAGILLILFYGSFIEPQRIKLNKFSMQIAGLPRMRIAIAGDFHVGPFKKNAFVKRITERLNAESPDLTVLIGDFLFDHTSDVGLFEPLKHLRARLGVFAVLGNHDAGGHLLHGERIITVDRSADVAEAVEGLGIPVLRNTHVVLHHEQTQFALAGIDDVWMESASVERAFDDMPDVPAILLSHNPDVILDPSSPRATLVISGHTHGGQIRLPFIGPLYPLPDKLGKAFDRGVFALDQNRFLVVHSGVGETMARARLFCPPEIMVLEIN